MYGSTLGGWIDDQREVEEVWSAMPTPFFSTPSTDENDHHNHLFFKEVVGTWHDEGPQLIGDCVSWGNARLVDYTSVLEMYLQLKDEESKGKSFQDGADEFRQIFEFACTEAIYALSRVEIGGQRGSRSDGSVGAWAAKAVTQFGSISRAHLDRLNLSGKYSGQRAKDWGASGLPDNLEPYAKEHPIADMTPVRTWNDLKFHVQNYRVVAVCSNVGFENGSGGHTQRDSQGFANPRGQWNHCMAFVSTRGGSRPGALLTNQWPSGVVTGPMGDVEIPPCSWWVDADVAEKMLRQNDSFTGTKYKGYPARKLTWRF